MANTKEIKKRIKSVKDTKKITNAMYLIASTKMRKAKAELDETRPYFNALQREIKRVFRTVGHIENKYMYPLDETIVLNGSYAYLVITADKGLAGAYNQNVIYEAERALEEHAKDEHADAKLFVVGEYGRQYFLQHKIPIERSFLYTAQNPNIPQARKIADVLLDLYDKKEIDKIYVIYTDMKSGIEEEVKITRLLPFHRKQFETSAPEPAIDVPFEFFPSASSVLDHVVRSYVTGFIYSALVDSFCSEQNARMTAMNAANQNADKILGELMVQYNRVRQAAITQEITEVSAGAKAQRQKKKKKQCEVEMT